MLFLLDMEAVSKYYSLMNADASSQKLIHRILRYAAVENLVYWLTGALAWVPWYYSDTLGILAMLVLVPITIFFGTLYSFNKIPQSQWKSEIWVIIATFVITCGLIDLFYWVIWRGNNILEWYLPTTLLGTANFAGYIEMIIACLAALFLALRIKWVHRIQARLSFGIWVVVISGVILFLFSLVSALVFW